METTLEKDIEAQREKVFIKPQSRVTVVFHQSDASSLKASIVCCLCEELMERSEITQRYTCEQCESDLSVSETRTLVQLCTRALDALQPMQLQPAAPRGWKWLFHRLFRRTAKHPSKA